MRAWIFLMLLFGAIGGCASSAPTEQSSTYQTIGRDPRRDTDTARAENDKALEMMSRSEWHAADAALQRALAADIMFGPAHNNLGKVYYHDNKLYLAAWEFEYAAKLMPHQVEPRNNIGLIFEAAGKWNDAIDNYNKALALEPENPEVVGNAARTHIRRGDTGPEVRDLLTKLVMVDTRPEWADWARKRLALMPTTAKP